MAESGNVTVPVINMQDFPEQSAKLVKACEEWGCFRIVNFDHILPKSLMMDMKIVITSLFELPMDMKMRNVDVIPGSGYMASCSPNSPYEALGAYDIACADDVEAFCSILETTPHQRTTITKYAKAVNELMVNLCRKFEEGLGVVNFSWNDRACHFRMNKYNITHENIGSAGLELHTDSNFFTVLQDDEILGGLQVMKKCGMFVNVDPFPGSLLVNLGDLATVWSNGRFLNVKHRVMCKEPGLRVSIASGVLGPKQKVIEIPNELVDANHPRLYVPFTYAEYTCVRRSHKLLTGDAINHFLV